MRRLLKGKLSNVKNVIIEKSEYERQVEQQRFIKEKKNKASLLRRKEISR